MSTLILSRVTHVMVFIANEPYLTLVDTSYYFKIYNNLLYKKTLWEVTQFKDELFNSHYLR